MFGDASRLVDDLAPKKPSGEFVVQVLTNHRDDRFTHEAMNVLDSKLKIVNKYITILDVVASEFQAKN